MRPPYGQFYGKSLTKNGYLFGEKVIGYKRELDQLSKETADALKFKHSDMYLHDREPQEADINEALNRITNEARSLVDENWDVIERVAEAFLDSRNKSTGEIARTKLDKIITMTEDLINQSG